MLPLVSTVPLGTSSMFTALTIGGMQCGTKVCEIYQYCSKYHNDCESCEKVCDEKSHNFDREQCLTDCQNYLHDRSYVKLTDYAAEIKSLKIYLGVTFLLTVIILILFLAINGAKIFRMCSQMFAKMKSPVKNKNKPVPEPVMMANPHTISPKMRPKLQTNNQNNLNRTSSIFTVTGTEYEAKTVSTPISTRYPAEDTLTSDATVSADYSYDNKALQLTPVHEEKPRIETTF